MAHAILATFAEDTTLVGFNVQTFAFLSQGDALNRIRDAWPPHTRNSLGHSLINALFPPTKEQKCERFIRLIYSEGLYACFPSDQKYLKPGSRTELLCNQHIAPHGQCLLLRPELIYHLRNKGRRFCVWYDIQEEHTLPLAPTAHYCCWHVDVTSSSEVRDCVLAGVASPRQLLQSMVSHRPAIANPVALIAANFIAKGFRVRRYTNEWNIDRDKVSTLLTDLQCSVSQNLCGCYARKREISMTMLFSHNQFEPQLIVENGGELAVYIVNASTHMPASALKNVWRDWRKRLSTNVKTGRLIDCLTAVVRPETAQFAMLHSRRPLDDIAGARWLTAKCSRRRL